MAKDPAALLYIDSWKVSTTEMSAVTRAYYMDLILHQYDKGSLPNDLEELANICRVRFSEFEQFKQVFEQVLKHKFEQGEDNRLRNSNASEIIRKRENFKDKRSSSGKMSYVIRFARKLYKGDEDFIEYLKSNIDIDNIDTKNEQVLKQVFKQNFELYINRDEDENKDININFTDFWNLYDKKVGSRINIEKKWNKLKDQERTDIIAYLPAYISSTPDKKFRKNPETWINQRGWEHEIIQVNQGQSQSSNTNQLYPGYVEQSDFSELQRKHDEKHRK